MSSATYLLRIDWVTLAKRRKGIVRRTPITADFLSTAPSLTGLIIHFDDDKVVEYGNKTAGGGYVTRTWPSHLAWYNAKVRPANR